MVGSRDMTSRIFSLFPRNDFTPITLSGHRNSVVGSYFEHMSLDVSFNPLYALCIHDFLGK